MRTNPEENEAFGRHIAERLNPGRGPCTVILPVKGISALDAPGQPFFDPEADEALFASLERHFRRAPHRRLVRAPFHINDPAFAEAALDALREMADMAPEMRRIR
jgi:uncharacterized protein (UPF0261 family)